MRILLDHCVDRHLARSFPNHELKTTREMAWDQLENGALLARAAGQFDVMLTVDQNLKHQQNLAAIPIAVIVLIAKTNQLRDLIPLAPSVEQALVQLKPKTLIELSR